MKKQIIFLVQLYFIISTVFFSCIESESLAGKKGGSRQNNDLTTTTDYGDLFILYRDASGIPILSTEKFTNENGVEVESRCQQPIASMSFAECTNFTPSGECLIPLDLETCTVKPEFAIYTQEVDFGRISEIRSPDSVLASQLEEALLRLNTAGCISLDPAGRLTYSSKIDGDVVTGTIDSPMQNLALYNQLMRTGNLDQTSLISGPEVILPGLWLDMAARTLGAAADKSGKINVDLVAYLNQILGLTDLELPPAPLEKKCIEIREEVKGVMQVVEKCFLLYGEWNSYPYNYSYSRGASFGYGGFLPSPPYIPADTPQAGWFEYLAVATEAPLTFKIEQGAIVEAVPELNADHGLQRDNIGGFAQAADDTRAVIQFMHTWPVPENYATKVTCDVPANVYYDVSISDASGLQVPVRMVAGTEGREGTVTIVNAGPATATGSVMVTGTYTVDGSSITIPLYRIDNEGPTEDPIFGSAGEEFELPAGYSKSWTFFFSMNTAADIKWQASISAEHDVNPNNNTVIEYTKVTKSKKGGRRKR